MTSCFERVLTISVCAYDVCIRTHADHTELDVINLRAIIIIIVFINIYIYIYTFFRGCAFAQCAPHNIACAKYTCSTISSYGYRFRKSFSRTYVPSVGFHFLKHQQRRHILVRCATRLEKRAKKRLKLAVDRCQKPEWITTVSYVWGTDQKSGSFTVHKNNSSHSPRNMRFNDVCLIVQNVLRIWESSFNGAEKRSPANCNTTGPKLTVGFRSGRQGRIFQ